MTNTEIAAIFTQIADLLLIKGDIIYKILAYRKAAESLTNLGRDVRDIWQEGGLSALQAIPGIGKATAEKTEELLETGELRFLQDLEKELPSSLVALLEVPDLGPKKVKLFWEELGVKTVSELEEAAKEGKLRNLPGMGEKSETKILEGIESLKRRTGRIPLGDAYPFMLEQIALLRDAPGVVDVEMAGSLRRVRETVGDLDILVAAEDSSGVMDVFTGQPQVSRVLGRGTTKASVEFRNGLRAQVWVHPAERFGTALQYATGSKDHNVRMRELAQARGYSLSEHALTPLEGGAEVTCAKEEMVYELLGIPWIPPELREDRGEMQAARKNALPALVSIEHIQSQLHNHSTWSDGRATIREMALAARERGFKVLAITDHSHSLGIVQGVSPDDLKKQRDELLVVQEEMGDTIRLLQGVELEIRADGTLDFADDVLAELDIVVASLHVSLRQPREQVTERLLNAIRNPHVDIIGHPTGRMIPKREGADLEMEKIFQAALEHGTVLEINAHPARLDLNDIYARRASELGIKLSINTDAHAPEHFDLLLFGVATARRAWVSPDQVINTWPAERLLAWLKSRG